MKELIESLGGWGVPTIVISILIGIFLVMQVTGEIIEWCGKTAPAWLKLRKLLTKRKQRIEKLESLLEQSTEALNQINQHYNPQAIAQRNDWMNQVNRDLDWMHQRADVYDASIDRLTDCLDRNTLMTEDMYVEDARDRIINFSNLVANTKYIVSKEQFKRIYRVYDEYEAFLDRKGRTNGEVDRCKKTIDKAYAYRQEHRSFAEDQNKFIISED